MIRSRAHMYETKMHFKKIKIKRHKLNVDKI